MIPRGYTDKIVAPEIINLMGMVIVAERERPDRTADVEARQPAASGTIVQIRNTEVLRTRSSESAFCDHMFWAQPNLPSKTSEGVTTRV